MKRLLILLLLSVPVAFADRDGPELPWQRLLFQASGSGMSVASTMTLSLLPGDELELTAAPGIDALQAAATGVFVLELELNSTRASGLIRTTLDAADLRGLHRSRFTQGRNRRLIEHRFGSRGASRERREPQRDSSDDPAGWPLSSRRVIDYPPAVADPVLAPESLLLLAAQAPLSRVGDRLEVLVMGDKQLYRVALTVAARETIAVDYRWPGGLEEQQQTGNLPSLRIDLEARPLSGETEQEPFDLLEMTAPLSIYLDPGRRLPLRLAGQATRSRRLQIDLRAVED